MRGEVLKFKFSFSNQLLCWLTVWCSELKISEAKSANYANTQTVRVHFIQPYKMGCLMSNIKYLNTSNEIDYCS